MRLFTNDHGLSAYVEKGAAAACERVWELPCDENLRVYWIPELPISKTAPWVPV